MAKISRKLDDIEKLVEKAHQTPKERLKLIDEELDNLKEVKFYGSSIDKDTLAREKTLLEAKLILLEQLEQEEDKKELDKLKRDEQLEKKIKKEIESLLFSNLKQYFETYNTQKEKVWQLINKSEVIKDEVKNICKGGYSEFEDYLLINYNKIAKQVYNIYKLDIKEEQENNKYNNIIQKQQKPHKKFGGWVGVLAFNGVVKKICKDVNGRRR